jgi:hypothetical protein
VLNLTDRLSVLAALRLDPFDNEGGLVGTATLPFQQTALSPKFGVMFQLVKDQVALFANYRTASPTAILTSISAANRAMPGRSKPTKWKPA